MAKGNKLKSTKGPTERVVAPANDASLPGKILKMAKSGAAKSTTQRKGQF